MNLLKPIDYFLDRITMYRLILYVLIILIAFAIIGSLIGVISFTPLSIFFSAVFLTAISILANELIAKTFNAPTNYESAYITALILVLIVSPAKTIDDYFFLFWVAVLAMASKYILAIKKKHLFNPAAIAVVITGYILNQSASWWVGNIWMMPVVLISGFLIIRKLRFSDLAWSFFTTSIVVSLIFAIVKNNDLFNTLSQIVFHSSLLFLGSIMLTEPLTLPPTKKLQMVYGAIVGFLSVPQVHLGPIFFAPELALVFGNIFAFLVSSKKKLLLYLDEKIRISPDVIDFIFKPKEKLAYMPGQYMEWTLPHKSVDSRGNRRYFTLASSPTEDNLRIGVKFSPKSSSYKKAMQGIDQNSPIVAAQLAGDFTMPKKASQKLLFIAGGIGITPFRSMIKYLLDLNERRDIVVLYSNKNKEDIVYKDIFDQAQEKLGIKVLYTLTNKESIDENWQGQIGRIDTEMIKNEIPDFKDRLIYISGPQNQIDAIKKVLNHLEVNTGNIKTDYFPGLA